VDGIHLAQDRYQWRFFVKRVINGPLDYVSTLIFFCTARWWLLVYPKHVAVFILYTIVCVDRLFAGLCSFISHHLGWNPGRPDVSQNGRQTRELNWLIGRSFLLTLENKILIYKTVLKPVWTDGIELLGCASKSNIAIIQRYQSKLLRTMTNAPWYVSNHILHTDLRIPYVRTVLQKRIAKHRSTLTSHPNPLLESLLQPSYNRRFKGRWTFDGLH
jgi:hypothetical protein